LLVYPTIDPQTELLNRVFHVLSSVPAKAMEDRLSLNGICGCLAAWNASYYHCYHTFAQLNLSPQKFPYSTLQQI
jgi:hypothetical protein